MRIEGGDKLGGRVCEGHWMGIDEQSKGVRIYWPDKKTISVERNIHYRKMDASASRLEGEIDGIIETKANDSLKASNQLNESISPPPIETPASSTPPHIPSPPPASEFAPEEPSAEKHTRKPSQHVVDLLEGRGRTSNCPSDPVVTCGIQTPTEAPNIELEGEVQADWMMAADFATEYVLVAEISETEALEPRTL